MRKVASAGIPDLFRRSIDYQDTSREAWRSFLPVSAELDRLILGAISDAGAEGIICEQIEERIGRSHQAVSGNLRHLVEKGYVVDTGELGKTRSNRPAMRRRLSRLALTGRAETEGAAP